MWSIHAFSVDGTEKLYIGAAMTTTAAISSSTSVSEVLIVCAWSALRASAGVKKAPIICSVRCGTGLVVRSRVTMVSDGWAACHLAMKAADCWRDREPELRTLLLI